MEHRMKVMYGEIGCFVACFMGWTLLCSTMPTEYWNVSTLDEGVLTAATYFSNLWKDCVTDSAGVSDCKDFASLMALDLYIHMCRALTITGIILGFFGAVLALVGMKCTKIGFSEQANTRVTFAAGVNYLIAGLCAGSAFSWYANRIRADFVDPNFMLQKYELGAAVFVGWGASTLLVVGGFTLSLLASKERHRYRLKSKRQPPSYVTARNRRMYMIPLAAGTASKGSKDNRFPLDSHV